MKSNSPEFTRLWGYSVGFYGVWIAHIGKQTGLLVSLSQKAMSVNELASSLGLDAPAVHSWCSAALSFGFVERRRTGKLAVPKKMVSILVDRSHPDYLGGQFSYLAMRSLEYDGFRDLFVGGQRRRTGASTLAAIEEATHWDHYEFLRVVSKNSRMHSLLSRGCRFIDIGCGTCSLISKLRIRYPRTSFVGLDISEDAVSKARELADGKSITVFLMAAEEMQFSDEFDIVFFGESLYAATDKEKVLENSYRALKHGGIIAIVEGLLPQANMSANDNRLIMGMQLDFALQGQQFMTRGELEMLMKKIGFVKRKFFHFGGCVHLVTAYKS